MITRHILSISNHYRQTASPFENRSVLSGHKALELIHSKKKNSNQNYAKYAEEMKILVTNVETMLCIGPMMSCPSYDTPLVCTRTTDLYNSCTQESHLVNYPGSQLGMLVNIIDRSLLIKEVVGHWLEMWRLKSERPFLGNLDNGA